MKLEAAFVKRAGDKRKAASLAPPQGEVADPAIPNILKLRKSVGMAKLAVKEEVLKALDQSMAEYPIEEESTTAEPSPSPQPVPAGSSGPSGAPPEEPPSTTPAVHLSYINLPKSRFVTHVLPENARQMKEVWGFDQPPQCTRNQ